MLFLIATITLNVVIFSVLKAFTRFNIDPLQAITVNYCICVLTGFLFTGATPYSHISIEHGWLPWAILMGVCFIAIFNLTAHCTRVSDMGSTVVASKLSLVIPVIFSIIAYHEHAGIVKVAGIVLAIPAVYLSSVSPQKSGTGGKLFWPALLFFMSGGLDTLVNYIQAHFLPTVADQAGCTITCFATAGGIGVIIVAIMAALGRITIRWQNIVAGIALGIPNFFSIFFLIRALNTSTFQSSATIPILNISILVASSMAAILVFRERSDLRRTIGLTLAIAAIVLIGMGDK